ncbi:MAG TPA: DsbA family protein [Stellaceae bacterium]|nr:DsbA family protein [Stellaceae bacterium]
MRKSWLFFAAIAVATSLIAPETARAELPSIQSDDRILGDPKAPITIFEYASLTCPHCAAFDEETLPKVKAEWIDTGKAKLVFRDYPLDQSSVLAATIARCFPNDKFFPFIDTLFKSQRSWAMSSNVKGALARTARLGGMSQDAFDKCTADQKLADSVTVSRLIAQNRYGIDSTPTFFVNGVKVVGDLPYDEFVKYLNGGKAEAIPGPTTPAASTSTAAMPTANDDAQLGLLDRVKRWFGTIMSRT